MEFFKAFGVDWKSLLAQFVNFAILLFLLTKLAYKPLLLFMKQRAEMIKRGVEDAKQAKQIMALASEEQEKLLAQARKEAASIVDSARAAAAEQSAAMVAQAKEEVARVVVEGKQALAAERASMILQAKKDVIDMVVSSTEKILGGVVDAEVDRAWLKSQLAKVK